MKLDPRARQVLDGAGPQLRALAWLGLALGAGFAAEWMRQHARALDDLADRAERRAEPHEARSEEILLT